MDHWRLYKENRYNQNAKHTILRGRTVIGTRFILILNIYRTQCKQDKTRKKLQDTL